MSLDGFFVDAHDDMSWAHKQDPEWKEFTSGNARGDGALLFGRVTYELMASFWPTPAAVEAMPVVAKGMNILPKIVFSRTLKKASWSNTALVKGDLVAEVRRMKKEPGPDSGLIDEFQMVVNPIVLGKGRTLFEGVEDMIALRLTKTRAFGNGNVVSCYEPAA